MNRFELPLLAIASASAAVCCFGAEPNYEQLKAVREISEMGGSVVIDENRPDMPVVSVELVSERVSDAGLECLESLRQLQSLNLSAPHRLAHFPGIGPTGTYVKWLPTGLTDTGLRHIKGLTHLKSLDLTGTKVGDNGLDNLEGLTQLESLNLSLTQVTSAGLKHLKRLTKLRTLVLMYNNIDDSGIEYLKDLVQLQSLNLQGTRVAGGGLIHLKDLPQLRTLDLSCASYKVAQLKSMAQPRRLPLAGGAADAELVNIERLTELESLNLASNHITDAGFAHLEGLVRLRSLDLSMTGITDTGLRHLKNLTQLRDLRLASVRVTGYGLADLKGLAQLETLALTGNQLDDLTFVTQFPKLKVLKLASTKVDDVGLLHLGEMAQLESLDISNTDVTADVVGELASKLPHCKIHYEPRYVYHYDGKSY